MRDIELIPYNRDANAKKMYLFMDWFLRKHKETIKDEAKKAIHLMIAYGTNAMDEMYDDFEANAKDKK